MSIYSHFHSGNYVGRLRKAKMTRFSFTNHDIWAGMLRRFIDKYSIDVLNSQCIHAIVFTICVEAIYRPSFFITMGQLWSPCPTLHNVVFYYTEATVKWLKSVSFLYFLIIGILLRWWRHDQLWCGVYRVRLR